MLLYSEIETHVIHKLKEGLSPALTYHNVAHTLDVLTQAVSIAKEEGIRDENDFLLLKISSLYHDVGFLDTYDRHEERSCEIAMGELAGFGFAAGEIDKICGMIRATKVPQEPKTQLEEIICDADLDYLGRSDFFSIAEGLFNEFRDQKIIPGDKHWNLLQIRFFENHKYFTSTAKRKRQGQKHVHLKVLQEKVSG